MIKGFSRTGRGAVVLIAVVGCFFVALRATKTVASDPVSTQHLGAQYTVAGPPEAMDIFLPTGVAGRRPVVVYIHGGGWIAGTRSGVDGYAAHFTGRGYVFCSIDYRLAGQGKYPAQIEDCKCAIRFLRAHAATYHLDPQRIGVWGESAGGNLAALLGTTAGVRRLEGSGGWSDQSSRVQAVMDWFGPTDLAHDLGPGYTNPQGKEIMRRFLGEPPDPKIIADASPIRFVTRGLPPFLIEHGDQDTLVPPAQSRRFYAALKAHGDVADFKVVAGAGHGGARFFTPENIRLADEFFDRALE